MRHPLFINHTLAQDRQKKLLKFARSKVHAWGIFARLPIKADETVVEYVGEVIRREVRSSLCPT